MCSHATVCKHVQLVKITTSTDTSKITTTIDTSETGTGYAIEYFTDQFAESKSTDCKLTMLQLQVHQKIEEFNTFVKSCQHAEALQASKKHLTSAIMVMKPMGHTPSKQAVSSRKRSYPPNKNAEQ